jgi:hypothetical protein
MNTVRIEVPGVPPSHNVLRRKYRNHHAYARLREKWRRDLWYSATPLLRARLLGVGAQKKIVKILISHKRYFDVDNAYAACKPILDAMVGLGWLKDDSPEWLELRVDQEKVNGAWTRIEVSEAK